jgi:hypothetical protein
MDQEFPRYQDIKNRHITNGSGGAGAPRTLSWRDLVKLPRPKYLIKNVLDRGALAEIYGPSGSGKSFFATDLALHVALGWQWCGRRVSQGGVLYVSAEGGTAIGKRLEAFSQHHLISRDVNFGAVIAPTNLREPADVEQLITDGGAVAALALIVIDTCARVMPGSKEDNEDMSRLVAACDEIRLATGAAIVLVHHTGKDVSRGSRGGNALPAAVDTQIGVTRDNKSKIITAELEKQRDGVTGPLASFVLHVIDLDIDEDGDQISSCVVEVKSAGEAAEKIRRLSPAQARALELLTEAIVRDGVAPPTNSHIPSGRRCASENLWRRYCDEGSISTSDKPNAKRMAFTRAAQDLIAAHRVGKWGDFVWIV